MGIPAYALTDVELLAACEETATRAGGPGGQHVNKTDSAVRLRHRVTGICGASQEHRERARNRVAALRQLRLALAVALRGVGDPAWLEPYRRGRQLVAGANAQDYPRLAAVALDALQRASGSPAAAALALGLSSSQVVKLLAADKQVLQAANQLRAAAGQGPLLVR
jgi:hypothetical protein